MTVTFVISRHFNNHSVIITEYTRAIPGGDLLTVAITKT